MKVVEGSEESSHHEHCHGQQRAANCHWVPLVIVNSQESEEDDNGKGEKGDESIGVDVRVAVLEHLGQH
jgi:hypothetical protein